MPTIKDLGRATKKKNPGKYDHLSDEAVGRAMRRKHAPAYDHYEDTALTSGYQESRALEKARQLQTYFDPSQKRFSSWMKALRVQGQSEHLGFLTSAMEQIIRQGAMLEDAALASRRKRQEYDNWLMLNQYDLFVMQQNANLLEQAVQQGLTVEGLERKILAQQAADNALLRARQEQDFKIRFEERIAEIKSRQAKEENQFQMNMEAHRAMLELQKLEQVHRHQMERAEREHVLKMSEFRQKSEAETQAEIEWTRERLRLTIIAEHLTGYQERVLLQEVIDNLYREIMEIRNNPKIDEDTKRRMIDDREAMIRDFKGEEDRLLQTDNWSGV